MLQAQCGMYESALSRYLELQRQFPRSSRRARPAPAADGGGETTGRQATGSPGGQHFIGDLNCAFARHLHFDLLPFLSHLSR